MVVRAGPGIEGVLLSKVGGHTARLDKFEVTALPANSAAQFVAYYFGAEKLAKAIVGINGDQRAVDAFHHRVGVKLAETKSAAHDMKLSILEAELDALFEPQWHLKQPSSAITIRNRLSHDFGPTQVCHIRQHSPRLVPIMVKFIGDVDRVLKHLRERWAASQARP
ncbi:hypothetical protein [Bradyrhizobium sp. URHD0069]|uniref:hypothetical protein n=1 Tax=Bradyrhizobium sp. URHD0069 TaxID=1380355 RepID=UPI000496BA63|nr:hypothetical protein [Bradyrhizobium sp. URHD0069]